MATPEVYPPVFGEATADPNDVPFGWAEFQPAASGMYSLGVRIQAVRSAFEGAQENASEDWLGPEREVFDEKCVAFIASTREVEGVLKNIADGLAEAWAAARGHQARVCAARAFAKREDDRSGWGKFWDGLAGNDRQPNSPSNPSTPTASAYRTTSAPHEDGCNTTGNHYVVDS